MAWNMSVERTLSETIDPLYEDEDGAYFPTDAEIDQWMKTSYDDGVDDTPRTSIVIPFPLRRN